MRPALLVVFCLLACERSPHVPPTTVSPPDATAEPDVAVEADTRVPEPDATADVGNVDSAADATFDAANETDATQAAEVAEEIEGPPSGYCLGSCRTDDDCGAGYACRDELFRYGTLSCGPNAFPQRPMLREVRFEGACLDDSECAARQACSLGRPQMICVPGCTTDRDCTELYNVQDPTLPWAKCTAGQCEGGIEGEVCKGTKVWTKREPPKFGLAYGACIPACDTDRECAGGYCADRP